MSEKGGNEKEGLGFEARLRRAMSVVGLEEEAFKRLAVETAVRRIERRHTRLAKGREDVDERLLSRLRVIVAKALREVEDWPALQARLRRDGVEYVIAGGGLALARCESGARLCKASEVGPGYKALVQRMGGGFPGHPHVWIERQVIAAAAATDLAGAPQPRKPAAKDACDLIDYGV